MLLILYMIFSGQFMKNCCGMEKIIKYYLQKSFSQVCLKDFAKILHGLLTYLKFRCSFIQGTCVSGFFHIYKKKLEITR